jgi:hypothetical protein
MYGKHFYDITVICLYPNLMKAFYLTLVIALNGKLAGHQLVSDNRQIDVSGLPR